MFVNTDVTALFFESKPKSTVHRRWDKTEFVCCSVSNSKWATLRVSVASDGLKLPLLTLLKGYSKGRIEKMLHNILPEIIHRCRQSEGRMDEPSLKIWTERIWKPYVSCNESSVLLSDNFSCRKETSFLEYLKSFGTDLDLLPGGCTCLLQPCNVGVMGSLKVCIQKMYMDLVSMVYRTLESHQGSPFSDPKDAFSWVSDSFGAISSNSIRATFDPTGSISTGQSPPYVGANGWCCRALPM